MAFGKLILLALSIILAIALFRALFVFKPLPPPKSCLDTPNHKRIKLDSDSINRFKKALNIRTVSYAKEQYEPQELTRLSLFIEENYPNIHRSNFVQKEIISNHTLLYTVSGSNIKLRPYMLTAHLDVVPTVDAKWSSDPFEAVIKEDKHLYARGTIDAKNLVVSILEALETLLMRGFRPKRSIYLVFGHDEEIGGLEGAQTISKILPNRLKINNWDKLEYILDEGNIISKSKIPGLNGPVALVGVVEKGYVTMKMSTGGSVGHGSMPPEKTAISKLAVAVGKFHSNLFPSLLGQGVEREMIDVFAAHSSWPFKFFYANFWLFKPVFEYIFSSDPATNSLIRTSTAVTMIRGGTKENVLPDSSVAYINHRIHPLQTIEDVLDYDQKIVGDPTISVEVSGHSANPTPTAPYCADCLGFQLIRQSLLQVYPGTIVVPSVFLAASDSRWYVNMTDAIYKFSAISVHLDEMKCFHGHDERISLENYENLINFFHHLIENSDQDDLNSLMSGSKKRTEL